MYLFGDGSKMKKKKTSSFYLSDCNPALFDVTVFKTCIIMCFEIHS